MLRSAAMVIAATVLVTAGAAENAPQPLARSADDPQVQWGPCPDFMPKGCGLAVLNGDPARGNADVFFRIPAGATAPSHSHTSAERMVLVSGELRVTYDGQKPFTMKPGMYAYGPAKHPHEATCASDRDCILFIAFVDPVDAIPTGTR